MKKISVACFVLAFVLGGMAHAATTAVAPGLNTLQAAVDAAADGDVLELSAGTYGGVEADGEAFGLLLPASKALTIRKASGAATNPVFHPNTAAVYPSAAGGNAADRGFLYVPSTASLTWDGVDILFDGVTGTPNATQMKNGLLTRNGAGKTVIFRNCAFSDTNRLGVSVQTPAPNHYHTFFDVAGAGGALFENVTWNLLYASGPNYWYNAGGLVEFRKCNLTVGRASVSGILPYGPLTFNDCTFISKFVSSAQWFSSFAGTSGGVLTFNRCFVDLSAAAPIKMGAHNNAAGAVSSINVNNSAIRGKVQATYGEFIISMLKGGNSTLKHSTFTMANDTVASDMVLFNNSAPTQTGGALNAGSLTVQNCIFKHATPRNYISQGTGGTTACTYTIGTNLVDVAPTASATEVINQTGANCLVGNIDLQSDFIHIGMNSAAIDKGADLGVTNDFDDQSRPVPAGTLPDLGCDEVQQVPVELSAFEIE